MFSEEASTSCAAGSRTPARRRGEIMGGISPSIPAPEGRGAAPGPTASIPRGPRPRDLAQAQPWVLTVPSRPAEASAPVFASHLSPIPVRPRSSPPQTLCLSHTAPRVAPVGPDPAVPTPVQQLTAMTGSADTSKPMPRDAGTTVGTEAEKGQRGTGRHSARVPSPRPPRSPLGGDERATRPAPRGKRRARHDKFQG